MTLTFTLKQPPRFRLDVSSLTPNGLAGRSARQIAAMPIWSGRRARKVGDLFDIKGEPLPDSGEGKIVFAKATGRLDKIGAGMRSGVIAVRGDAGAYAGFAMSGGAIDISGDAGIYAGSAMTGGQIRIAGDAGDFLGGAIPGERIGMNGGVVVVMGDAGNRVGDHMRRGNILIAGNAGAFCGARMTAGSIVVRGKVREGLGFAMRRGTILLYKAPPRLADTFNDCGSHQLQFLGLYLDYLSAFGAPFARKKGKAPRARRIAGDIGVGGRGEILILQS